MLAPTRKEPLLWSFADGWPQGLLAWCPDGKQIAFINGSNVRLYNSANGSHNNHRLSDVTEVCWVDWIPMDINECQDSVLVVCSEEMGNSQLRFYLNGIHDLGLKIEMDSVPLKISTTAGLSRIAVVLNDGRLIVFSTQADEDSLQKFKETVERKEAVTSVISQISDLISALEKYLKGLRWLKDKLAACDPELNLERTVTHLFLLQDSSDNHHKEAMKKGVAIRDAYKFRDQLVRCGEELRNKFEIVKTKVPLIGPIVEELDASQKVLLSWFLSLFSISADEKESLSRVVKALCDTLCLQALAICRGSITSLESGLRPYEFPSLEPKMSASEKLLQSNLSPETVGCHWKSKDELQMIQSHSSELLLNCTTLSLHNQSTSSFSTPLPMVDFNFRSSRLRHDCSQLKIFGESSDGASTVIGYLCLYEQCMNSYHTFDKRSNTSYSRLNLVIDEHNHITVV